jgi:hypothetical protein
MNKNMLIPEKLAIQLWRELDQYIRPTAAVSSYLNWFDEKLQAAGRRSDYKEYLEKERSENNGNNQD